MTISAGRLERPATRGRSAVSATAGRPHLRRVHPPAPVTPGRFRAPVGCRTIAARSDSSAGRAALHSAVIDTLRALAPEPGAGIEHPRGVRDEPWRAFLAGARLWPMPPLVVGYHGHQCHRSAAFLAARYGRIAFGYALGPMHFLGPAYWLVHSWLVDDAGRVVEPTPDAMSAYVGAILPPALAAAFIAHYQAEALDVACAPPAQ